MPRVLTLELRPKSECMYILHFSQDKHIREEFEVPLVAKSPLFLG